MSQTLPSPVQMLPLPEPRTPIRVRPATMDDLPFIDALQSTHTRQLGWMPRAQLEGKIRLGHVLVAEEAGYIIGNDQYFKRDDCGIIYQLCVAQGQRRGLIGAALVRALVDRAAYGCRLFCCWCAQDIEANSFWESLGFVPLAFRAGSRTKGPRGAARVHIFWQKRVVEGDTVTPYWFPAQTSAGAIREDRLVFPIPPGTHWRDAKPIILPGQAPEEPTAIIPAPSRPARRSAHRPKARPREELPANVTGGLRFAPPSQEQALAMAAATPAKKPRTKAPRVAQKNDPRHVAFARELRDRYLEALRDDPTVLLPRGKYDLCRQLAGHASIQAELVRVQPQLTAAA